jgi:membrane-bound lytic murein transglycosylase B
VLFFLRLFFVVLCLILVNPLANCSPTSQGSRVRGWDHLAKLIHNEGVPHQEILKVYSSKQMPYRPFVSFKMAPKEGNNIYRDFIDNAPLLAKAKKFLVRYIDTFRRAYSSFGVEPEIIASILLIETKFGEYTGKNLVIERLSRAASVAEPSNVEKNWQELRRSREFYTLAQVKERALKVQSIFLPEIVALFKISDRNKIDIFAIKGSVAGAFGMSQFLPSSYLRFGVDGNRDGRVSLFQPEDAIFSVAKYFSSSGWRRGISEEEMRKAIWLYNKSDAYIDTVLHLRSRLYRFISLTN